MGLFDLFKKKKPEKEVVKEIIVTPEKALKSNKEKPVIVAPFPFEEEKKSLIELTERQYDSLYNRFDNAYEKFSEAVDEVDSEFTFDNFDYEARVKVLKKACREFDKCFKIVAPYWYEDWYFMDMLELHKPDKWTKEGQEDLKPSSVLEIDDAPEKWHYTNINFLRWLLSEYERQGKALKPLLKEKEFERLVKEHGSEEAAYAELRWREEQARFEKEYPKFKATIKEIIISNPEILQKDIKKHFSDEFWHKYIPMALKEFEADGKIAKVKSGNTYKVTWKE